MPVEPKPVAEFLGGQTRFGLLTFVAESEPRALVRTDGRRFVRMGQFRCGCGADKLADLRNVRRGLTRSCGCHMGKQFSGAPSVRERLRQA